MQLSYWKNFIATIPLANPNAIDKSGTYYITGVLNGGCAAVKAVDVKIGAMPNIIINNPKIGASSARNSGVKKSSGELLLFLDDDIIVNSSNIIKILSLL